MQRTWDFPSRLPGDLKDKWRNLDIPRKYKWREKDKKEEETEEKQEDTDASTEDSKSVPAMVAQRESRRTPRAADLHAPTHASALHAEQQIQIFIWTESGCNWATFEVMQSLEGAAEQVFVDVRTLDSAEAGCFDRFYLKSISYSGPFNPLNFQRPSSSTDRAHDWRLMEA